MGEPPIRYTSTRDGFRIAYCESGQGFPLVLMPAPVQHLSLMWRSKYVARLYEGLSSRFRLVQYDGRGTGLSDRGLPEEYSASDNDYDLEAVVDRLGLERFLLFGPHGGSHVAIRYAVMHPERVRGLILWQAIGDADEETEAGFLVRIAAENWERALVMQAQTFMPGEELQNSMNVVRECFTKDDFIKLAGSYESSVIDWLLPRLRVPVLLLYKTATFRETARLARKMATAIRESRLVFLDDDGDLYGYPRDCSRLIQHVQDFARSLGILTGDSRSEVADLAAFEITSRSSALTRRESEVLKLIASGRMNKEIALDLAVSERTVARHITNLYAKIEARSKADATAYALRNGFV
jgi:DNA-binding CsgD family transcriptional regulator/pimeloyl-ACP methyl ester carboxylesterase